MGVIKFGIKMLIKEKKQSISYLLSMVFATALILNNFNILFNTDFSENDFLELKFSAIGIALVVLVGALLFVVYASLYFIYGKTKMLSIALSSGQSIFSVGLLLAVQNFLLGLLGIIIGVIVGIAFIPLSNTLVYLGIGMEIKIFAFSMYGLSTTIFAFVSTLISVSMVGLGYAYRRELVDLLNGQKMKNKKRESLLKFRVSGIVWWALYFLPLLGLFLPISIEEKSKLIPASEFITLFSIFGLVKISIPQLIKNYKRKHCQFDKIKTIAISNLISILEESKYLLVYLLFAVRYLVLEYIDALTTDKVRVVIIICYGALIITASITIMYKVIIKGLNRKNTFKQLNLIGYTKEQINKVIFSEISLFYLIVIMIPLVHIVAMIVTSPMAGAISYKVVAIMVGLFICLFSIAYVISLKRYRKIVFRDLEGGK